MAFGYFPPRTFRGLIGQPIAEIESWWYGADNLLKRSHVAESFRLLGLSGRETVLEVGAGDGLHYSGEIARRCAEIVAVDHSSQIVETFRRRRFPTNMSIVRCDAESIPLPNSSRDLIFVSELLTVLNDPLRAMREFARILRPGGRLVTVHGSTFSEMRDIWLEPDVMADVEAAALRWGTPRDVDQFIEQYYSVHGTKKDRFIDRDAFVAEVTVGAGLREIERTWRVGPEAKKFYCRRLVRAMRLTGRPVLGAGQVKLLPDFIAADRHWTPGPDGLTLFTSAVKPD